jgi:hypothetical protein
LTTRILVQFIGQIGAVILLRRLKPAAEMPFRMWLYPLPALLALVGWIFLFCTTEPRLLLVALIALLLGVACFLAWAWRTRRWPFTEGRGTLEC